MAGAAAIALVAASTVFYRSGTFPDLILAPAALLTTSAISGGRRYVQETLDRRRIYDLFGRYVPRTVVAELVRRPTDRALALGGDKRELTVLFADVRGFTSLSDHLPPEEVLGRLNAVLQSLVHEAFDESGTVDKYIGDAVMVLFNAPLEQDDHPERAVRAALKMQAARLCESALKGEVIISEELRKRLGDKVEAERRTSAQRHRPRARDVQGDGAAALVKPRSRD